MKRTISVHLGKEQTPLGTLFYDQQGARESAAFEYDAGWLASPDRFAIEPGLRLVTGPQFHRKAPDGSLFHAAFADTEPDGWARRVIQRDHAKRRQEARRAGEPADARPLNALDFLLAVDDFSRVGALRLMDEEGRYQRTVSEGRRTTPPLVELAQLMRATRAVETNTESMADLDYLRGRGTSLGGLRPKCSVLDNDGSLAIGKFPSVSDERSVTKGEVLALRLARKAGIDVAEARIVDSDGSPHRSVHRVRGSRADDDLLLRRASGYRGMTGTLRKFCSELALSAPEQEPLLGTAHYAAGFILIAWPRRLWARQHFQSQGLPVSLVALLKQIQRHHRYFVRLVWSDDVTSLEVMVMPENRRRIPDSLESLELVLATAFSGDRAAFDDGWAVPENSLLLVCTNGVRDRCCAKFGFAVYKEAARLQQDRALKLRVLQSTHLTGDRFAACAMSLPDGDLFGWLRADNVEEMLNAVSRQKPPPLHFRGNSYLDEADQIVDGCLRLIGRGPLVAANIRRFVLERRQTGCGFAIDVRDRNSRTPIGRIVLSEQKASKILDCDGLDRNLLEDSSRLVLTEVEWC